jgi:hypothetical protein
MTMLLCHLFFLHVFSSHHKWQGGLSFLANEPFPVVAALILAAAVEIAAGVLVVAEFADWLNVLAVVSTYNNHTSLLLVPSRQRKRLVLVLLALLVLQCSRGDLQLCPRSGM